MSDLLLRNGHLWTGNGDEVLTGHDVRISDGRIVSVGAATLGGTAVQVIDCTDRWIVPGLIDCHMHFFGARRSDPVYWAIDPPLRSALRAAADARRVLAAGFTSVRDAGSRVGVALAEAIASGEAAGPRVVPAYLGISRTGGHGDVHSLPLTWVQEQPFMALVVDGPEQCRRAVRQIARAGARWVKVWATGGVLSERDDPRHSHLTPEELSMIVTEAHAVGLPVGAHCEGLPATKECVRAGVDVIEHGFYLDEEVAHEMAMRGVPLVTTLAFLERTAAGHGGDVPTYAMEAAQGIVADAGASVRLAHELGVPIAMGTDTFAEPLTPFGRNAEELRCLRNAGLDAVTCLEAATCVAAGVLGLGDEVGRIEVGRRADLLVLDGGVSPLDDVGAVIGAERTAAVIANGAVVSSDGREAVS